MTSRPVSLAVLLVSSVLVGGCSSSDETPPPPIPSDTLSGAVVSVGVRGGGGGKTSGDGTFDTTGRYRVVVQCVGTGTSTVDLRITSQGNQDVDGWTVDCPATRTTDSFDATAGSAFNLTAAASPSSASVLATLVRI